MVLTAGNYESPAQTQPKRLVWHISQQQSGQTLKGEHLVDEKAHKKCDKQSKHQESQLILKEHNR